MFDESIDLLSFKSGDGYGVACFYPSWSKSVCDSSFSNSLPIKFRISNVTGKTLNFKLDDKDIVDPTTKFSSDHMIDNGNPWVFSYPPKYPSVTATFDNFRLVWVK